MSSKYDNIKTDAELVAEVQIHGLSLAQEDICRAQDIFGHTPIKELVRLANDIGRNNENSEPDPKGTRSSDRRATQNTFYSILTNIWHWEEVTRFWNTYTNHDHEKLVEVRAIRNDLKEQLGKLEAQLEESRARTKEEHEARLAETAEKLVAGKEINRLEAELHSKVLEIMELKSKLYDLLVERKEVA